MEDRVMYDIFDIAVEKGMEKGREQQARELLMAVLSQSVGTVPSSIIDSVNQISRWDVLRNARKITCSFFMIVQKNKVV
jgi:galactose-1-phosphate uridylyltransferase